MIEYLHWDRSQSNYRRMRKYWNQMLLGMAFVATVLIAVVIVGDARSLAKRLESFPVWYFLPIIVLKVMNWLFSYLEWHYFLHVIGVNPVLKGPTAPAPHPDQPATIRVQDSLILWMASLPFILSPGKIAEIIKALALKNLTGTPITRSAPIIFAERLVDGIAVVLLVGASAGIASDAIFTPGDVSPSYLRGVLIGISLFMLGLIVLIQFRGIIQRIITVAGQLPIVQHLENPLRTLYDSSYDLVKLRHLMPTTVFGMGAYFTDCVGFYFMLVGLGANPSGELFVQATFILGFSIVVSAISAMPGGAGGREITIAVLLSSIVGMGGAANSAAVLMIGIFQVWFGALVGIIIAIVFRHRLFPVSLERELSALEEQHNDDPATAAV